MGWKDISIALGIEHNEDDFKDLDFNHPLFNPENPQRGELNPMYGSARFGHLNPMYGKKHSEETKKKIREKRAQQIFPDNFSEIMSKAVKEAIKNGRKNGYGKPGMHSEEGKSSIGKAASIRNSGKKRIYNKDGTWKMVKL